MPSASGDKKLQPIVVKRIRKARHGGHHGGAWKIAYADFVTAMMAFFLLMWLLGSTTKGDLQGIADYFRTPMKVAMQGGSGSGDSSSVIRGGGMQLSRTVGQTKSGDVQAERRSINLQALRDERLRQEEEKLLELKGRVEGMMNASQRLAEYKSQVRLDVTPEGLRIQIVDEQNRPMFDTGGAAVKDYMREILRGIGKVLNDMPNRVTLTGHTDASPYGHGERGYSNWELSADRANASRRELVAGGMAESKVLRVVGVASSLPLDERHPLDPVNRRISIMVMNRDAEDRILGVAPPGAGEHSILERLSTTAAAARESAAPPTNGKP